MINFHVERHNSSLERAPRATRACVSCHARKVRCDVSVSKQRCTNCQQDGQLCEPRLRQKRSKNGTRMSSNLNGQTHSNQSIGTPRKFQETVAISRNTSSQNLIQNTSMEPQCPGNAAEQTNYHHEQPPDSSPASVITNTSSTYESGYLGRSAYLAPESFRGEDGSEVIYAAPNLSEINKRILNLRKALEFPPRAVRDGLFENFWTYCYPWDPIIERSAVLNQPLERLSPFLLQAIFLAGSRMSSAAASYASLQEFYERAKILFYLDYEQDSLMMLTAVSLLHWWNPHGPERVSTNTSSFWGRIAVGLAQQMGLHSHPRSGFDESRCRKIWWSLVARDCLVSAAHGRPRAIHLDDCDVARPTVDDFPGATMTGLVFIAYVDLSLIMGQFTTNVLRKTPTKAHVADIEDSLYRWVLTLPKPIRISPKNGMDGTHQTQHFHQPYHFECRQIHVLYLVNLILLYRPQTLDGPFPVAAVIAASTVAGIFEEFLARDQVRLLGPMFTFHLLASAIALLSCCRYPGLWETAEKDLRVIRQAQDEMKKKWASAIGSIRSFERMYKLAIAAQKSNNSLPENKLSREQAIFFQELDTGLCRTWEPLQNASLLVNSSAFSWPAAFGDESAIGFSMQPVAHPLQPELPTEQLDFDEIFQNEASQLEGEIGNWLFWDQNPPPLSFGSQARTP